MEIVIKDREFIEHSVKARDVFSRNTMFSVYQAIKQDFYDEVVEQWHNVTPEELGYDWKTVEGELKLKRQAIDYAIYASELSLYDFLQEFEGYLVDGWAEYEDFIKEVEEGRVKLISEKDLT